MVPRVYVLQDTYVQMKMETIRVQYIAHSRTGRNAENMRASASLHDVRGGSAARAQLRHRSVRVLAPAEVLARVRLHAQQRGFVGFDRRDVLAQRRLQPALAQARAWARVRTRARLS